VPPEFLAVSEAPGQVNRIALDPARSVVVGAVAGSGKTWLLVSRMLRLLIDGIAPSEILAITFTRKAAQEMATRLRDWLRELATMDEARVRAFLLEREVPETQLDDAVKRARPLYEQFLTAQPPITIATFHGWFLQLLKRAPLEAGALGDVNLVEQTGALVDEAWQRFGSRVQREAGSDLARALDTLFRGYGLDMTRKLLRNFVMHRAEWWAYTRDRTEPVQWALQRIASEMEDPHGNAAQSAFSDPELKADLWTFAALLVRNTPTDINLARGYLAAGAGGNADIWFDAACDLVLKKIDGTMRIRKASAAQAKRLGRDEALMLALHESLGIRLLHLSRLRANQICYRVNEAALTCGVALVEAYQAVKDERQAIDYGDIEWLAYSLVSHGEHAAHMHYKLDARYRHILLDEFQDTNPLQWLTLKSWFAAAAEAGSQPVVFLVGDPKQSIYRFRGAEARLFDEAALYLKEAFGASQVPQHESRRCAPPVIDVVNRLFGAEPDFGEYEHHTAHYARPGRVEVLPLVPKSDRKKPRDAEAIALRNPLEHALEIEEDLRRESEACQLVERIRSVVGVWQLADDKSEGGSRPARYKDIMILVKRRTHLGIYEHALRAAQIPYITSRQGGLLGTLEAQDMTALLQFLVAPFASLKLAHVLRSPTFGCTDEDLLALAQANGNTWWQRLANIASELFAGPALSRAYALLTRWLARSDSLPVHDQLDRIYFEGDVMRRYEQAVPQAMRGSVRANLHAFMQRALDTDAGRYPSLPRFLHELIDLGDAAPQEAPDEGIIGDAGDAVRILTVHGAKGLESPVVWLLEAGAGTEPGEAYEVMIDWPPHADAPEHFSLCTRKAEHGARQRELAEGEDLLEKREDLNLLYVAMTRAQQALIVSGCDGQGREGSWYEKVRHAVRAAASADLAQDDLAVSAVHGADLAGKTARAPPSGTVSSTSPTTDPRLSRPVPTGVRREVVTGRGQRYGTHFHGLLERLTSSRAARREAIQHELGLSDREFEPMWQGAQRLLADPALARFFDDTKYVRAANEVAYVTSSGEVRRIDRLVELEAEVWVLDYKTGAPPAGGELLAQYDAQLEEYRATVSAMMPAKAVRAMLLFSNGEHREVSSAVPA
jgi:ATP-dependent helicase/nuclease subunit A